MSFTFRGVSEMQERFKDLPECARKYGEDCGALPVRDEFRCALLSRFRAPGKRDA